MRIELKHTLNDDCPGDLIHARIHSALDTFASQVDIVRVTTGDVNAAKGGCDKTCRVTVHLNDGAVLTVSDRRPELPAAVTWAAGKAAEAVRRRVEKRHRRRRSGPSYGTLPADSADGESGDDPAADGEATLRFSDVWASSR